MSDQESIEMLRPDQGRDLTEEARAGLFDWVLVQERERETFQGIAQGIGDFAALLAGEPGSGRTTILYALAKAIVQGTAPNPFAGKRLLLAPSSADHLEQFARDLSSRESVVVAVELDDVLAGSVLDDATDAAIMRALRLLFASPSILIVFVCTPDVSEHRLRPYEEHLYQTRLIARGEALGFCIRYRSIRNDHGNLIFPIEVDKARELIEAFRANADPRNDILQAQEELRQQIAEGRQHDRDNHTVLGGMGMWIFDSMIRLQAGQYHVLTIDDSEGWTQLQRDVFDAPNSFLDFIES